MLRLPRFQYFAPESVEEAARLLAQHGTSAMLMAGGTDVLPNMKRRQHTPAALISLRRIAALRNVANGEGLSIGAGTTLASLLAIPQVRDSYRGLWQAAAQIATPHLRNMGTIGGNLCLDTRCNYYDQSYEWRRAIDFCMKKDGCTCWVAPSSPRCLAVSSTDTAPMLVALGASVSLLSARGERRIPAAALFRNDGMQYLTRLPDELLTAVHLPAAAGWRSAYWKLRRRGAFDFPVVSAAVAVRPGRDGTVEDGRIVLGAVSSAPLDVSAAVDAVRGTNLDDEAIGKCAELAAAAARPMDNTDFSLHWRKRAVRAFVAYALRELRGDDVRELRQRVGRIG